MTADWKAAAYSALARPSGGFAMIANDARESLRAQVSAQGLPDGDEDLSRFKVAVAEALGAHCSGMLIDGVYGRAALEALRQAAPRCGRILAVDRLEQARGGRLQSTDLDDGILSSDLAEGVHALKLLVLWRPDEPEGERVALSARFVSACASLGLLSVLECVIDLPPNDRRFDDGLVQAASELAAVEPDIYKTHVPTCGMAEDDVVEEQSRRVTEVLGCPWVVLSNGVARERFAGAVAAACRGGASGFLAGRAAWASALAAPDPREELMTAGAERTHDLSLVVDAHARPWVAALTASLGDDARDARVVFDASS